MELTELFWKDVDTIRLNSPLVHNITNFVVMNNTANALLAIGASPVMAHAVEEVEDMVSIASSLVINIGTLNPEWVEGMVKAGKVANKRGIPVVFDPVGAGATPYRIEVCKQIIEVCKPSIIRGNASEIMALVNHDAKTKGVDSTTSSHSAIEDAKALAQSTGAIVSVSGVVDYITDGKELFQVAGGSDLMPRVTGMGCTSTAITAAFAAVNPNTLQAAVHAMQLMSLVGAKVARESAGPGSFQMNFLDELYLLKK